LVEFLSDPEKFFDLNVRVPVIVKVTQKLVDDLVIFNLPELFKVKPVPKRCVNNHKYFVSPKEFSEKTNSCPQCHIPLIPIGTLFGDEIIYTSDGKSYIPDYMCAGKESGYLELKPQEIDVTPIVGFFAGFGLIFYFIYLSYFI